jgi:DNA-binding NtrC family response regulator
VKKSCYFLEKAARALGKPVPSVRGGPGLTAVPDPLPTLGEAEAALIAETLRRAEGNQGVAAGMLGLSRQALNKRLSRLKHDPPLDTGEG